MATTPARSSLCTASTVIIAALWQGEGYGRPSAPCDRRLPPAAAAAAAASTHLGHIFRVAGPGAKDTQFAGGYNACQFGQLSPYFETYFAALNHHQFSMGMCGRCAAVRGTGSRATGKTVVVKIVDECMGCGFGSLDLTSKVGVIERCCLPVCLQREAGMAM